MYQESGVWVKRVEVKPKGRLSLQKHAHRSEKWNIVSGNGLVTLDDKEIPVKAGSVIDVPVGAVHRIANVGDDKLVFIEVACGEHLSELWEVLGFEKFHSLGIVGLDALVSSLLEDPPDDRGRRWFG